MRQSLVVQFTTALWDCLWLAQLLVCPILALTCNIFCVLSCIAHVEEKWRQSLIVQPTTALWECLQQSWPRRLFNPPTMDCSCGVFKWDRFLSCNSQLHFESDCDWRKTATTRIERAGFGNEFVDKMNRWRAQENAQGRQVKRRMNALYADALLLMPTTWVGSFVL